MNGGPPFDPKVMLAALRALRPMQQDATAVAPKRSVLQNVFLFPPTIRATPENPIMSALNNRAPAAYDAIRGAQRYVRDAIDRPNPVVALGNALGLGDPMQTDGPARAVQAFHGTNALFDAFDASKMGSATDSGFLGRAFYFSTDPRVAESSKYTVEADVGLNNPLSIALASFRDDKRDIVRKALGLPSDATAEEVTKAARERGHDGVELDYGPTGYHHKEIAAFDADKIRDIKRRANR